MFKNLFIFVNFENPNSWESTLPLAVGMARENSGIINVLSVVPDFGMAVVEQFFEKKADHDLNLKVMEALKAFISEHIPADITTRPIVAEGSVRECILKMSKQVDADLILLPPTRYQTELYDLGATAAHVTRHAQCSVMIVRKEESQP